MQVWQAVLGTIATIRRHVSYPAQTTFCVRREDGYVHPLLECEDTSHHLLFKESVFLSEKTLLFSTECFLRHRGFR